MLNCSHTKLRTTCLPNLSTGWCSELMKWNFIRRKKILFWLHTWHWVTALSKFKFIDCSKSLALGYAYRVSRKSKDTLTAALKVSPVTRWVSTSNFDTRAAWPRQKVASTLRASWVTPQADQGPPIQLLSGSAVSIRPPKHSRRA